MSRKRETTPEADLPNGAFADITIIKGTKYYVLYSTSVTFGEPKAWAVLSAGTFADLRRLFEKHAPGMYFDPLLVYETLLIAATRADVAPPSHEYDPEDNEL